MNLTRRQLLQTTAAAALAAGLPETAEAAFFHSGAAPPPVTNGTTAQASALLASINHRLSFASLPTLYLPPWDNNHPGAQYSSQGTLASTTFPTTMTLVQDGAVAAGVPTQSFGWVFRPGDIPKGHAPLFQVGGVTWPYSAGLQTYWPDGSLRWAAFALMVPLGFAPALNSSTTVTISDGGFGTWPAASGRTLAEIYAQSLIVNGITPATPIYLNARTTNLYALLNGDSNQYYAVKDLDGAAGARWTIKTKMQATTTANGTPDAQFVVTHRVWAMNNPSGALAGFRWFGEIRQPFYDDSTGVKKVMTFQPPSTGSPATGLNWQTVGPGNTAAVHNPAWLPFRTVDFFTGAKNFTGQITGNVLTVTGSSPPTGYLVIGAVLNASYGGGGTGDPFVISGWTDADPPICPAYWAPGTIIAPDGTPCTCQFYGVRSGGNGPQQMVNVPAAAFTSQPVLYSQQIGFTGGTSGLLDGGSVLVPGAYVIVAQLTITGGDQPGQRGTYLLNASVSSPIGPEPMTYSLPTDHYNGRVWTVPQQNWQSGAQSGNIVQVVITGGADLPPIDSGWILGGTNPCSGANNSLCFSFGDWPSVDAGQSSSDGNPLVFTGPGIGTMTPAPSLNPYCRFNMATAQGRYNFFQGTPSTGAITAETTLRVQINRAYWQSTGTFMPLDLSVDDAALPDTPWQYNWNPYTVTFVRTSGIDGFGPPIEVGLMTNSAIWDFYKQSPQTEIESRSFGLSPGTIPCDFKSGAGGTFDRLLNMAGIGPTYSGLPAPSLSPYIIPLSGPGGNWWDSSPGYSNKSPYACYGSGLNNPTHEPDLCQWAFMRFGEMQFFDFMCEWAQMATASQNGMIGPGQSYTAPPFPYEAYGAVIAGSGQFRGTGWGTRDLIKAAFWCSHDPSSDAGSNGNPVFSDGTDLQGYLIAQADKQTAYAIAMMDSDSASLWASSQAGADYIKAAGMWQPRYGGGLSGMQVWQAAYTAGGMMPSALRGNPAAIDFIKRWMSWLDRIGNNTLMKGTSANAYIYLLTLGQSQTIQIPGTNSGGNGGQGTYPVITRDEQLGSNDAVFWDFGSNDVITWIPNTSDGTTITGNAFAFEPVLNTQHAWTDTGHVPYNGDWFFALVGRYTTNYSVPSALVQSGGPYFVRDLAYTGVGTSGNPRYTFNVAATLGGAAIPITDSTPTGGGLGSVCNIWHSAAPSVDDPGQYGNAYGPQIRNTVNWIHAIGSGQTTNPGHNGNQFAGFT